VSGVPLGDIPCYPKHEAVIPQHLPYVSAAYDGRKNGRDGARGWGGKPVSGLLRGH
jgi:hypothetical protein